MRELFVRILTDQFIDSSAKAGRASLAGLSDSQSWPGRFQGHKVAMLVGGLCFLLGCGNGETTINVTPPPAAAQLRSTLEQIGEAGVIDSSVEYATQLAGEIAAEDPSKSALVAETEKLKTARGKTAIKKQVAEILTLLD